MSRATEIYPYLMSIDRELEKARSDPFNGPTIQKYYNARVAEGLSAGRIYKCVNTLRLLSKMLRKSFDQATKEDIVALVAHIEQRPDLGEWARRDYKIILKHFYRWLKGYDEGTPPEVRWIKNLNHVENRNPIMPRDLLTPEEKTAMAAAAFNLRDKALIEVFSESGRRLGEILSLHMRDVEFDELGAKLSVNGKMGEDFARIISSAPSLAIWLDHHPLRDNPDAPVWIGFGARNRHKQMTHSCAAAVLKKIAKRAGIKRRVHFYLFRHTRIDETQGFLTEAQQCMMFGWRFGSRMPGVYMKRYGKHIDNAQLIMNGLTPPKIGSVPVQRPKHCNRCGLDNSPVSKFCNRCGTPLDAVAAVKADESKKGVEDLLMEIAENPEKLQKLRAFLSS